MIWPQNIPTYLTTIVIRPVRWRSIACRMQVQELLHLLDATTGRQRTNAGCCWHQVVYHWLAVMVQASGWGRSVSRTVHQPSGISRQGQNHGQPMTTLVRDPDSTTSIDRVTTVVPPIEVDSLDKVSRAQGERGRWQDRQESSGDLSAPAWTSVRQPAPLSYEGRCIRKNIGLMNA